MKEIDSQGLEECRFQAAVFQESLERCACSSAVFIRRFMYSSVARRLDAGGFLFESSSTEAVFDYLDEEYGETAYGSVKLDADILYWVGYMYRYWAYTLAMSSVQIYKLCGAREMAGLYYSYHSLDPAQAIERIMEAKGIDPNEDMISKGVRLLREIRKSGRFEYAVVQLPPLD